PRRPSLMNAMPRLGRMTYAVIGLYAGTSLIAKLLGGGGADSPTVFIPDAVLHGQVWRLLTYPWIDGDAWAFIINVWVLAVFLPPLEREWGERRLLYRTLAFIIVPPVLLTLLGLAVRDISALGFAFPVVD